jgi:parallel beta-helix repeat protein
MAGLLVLLAGGANALATTVWTVSKTSSNVVCSLPSATCNTIGAAYSVASAGDVIVVGPGTYNEYLKITKSITLLGAQAGNDARGDRHDPSKESIVSALAQSDAIDVYNAYVVIDGFTLQGAAGYYYGIEVEEASGNYTARILNNIFQNNGTGLYLARSYNGNVLEHNLFRNNSAGGSGVGGYGIYIYDSGYDLINENEFTGNKTAAIYADYYTYYGTITNNTSENDGAFVVFVYGNIGVKFCHNRGKNFGRGAFSGAGDAAVAISLSSDSNNNSYLDISDNDLENGEGPIVNGIAFSTFFETSASSYAHYVNVTNNRIKGFPQNGIVVEQSGGTGTLQGAGSYIVGNEVSDNGNDGILIEGPTTSYNSGISFFQNEAKGNRVNDCEDDTTGAGPLGTNTWWNNIGNTSSPAGLCAPGRSH